MSSFNDYIPKFNSFLSSLNLSFEGVVIGGAAMQLLGLSERVTKDCDVLTPEIPESIKLAATQFAVENSLAPNWFNNGPASLIRDLPSEWREGLVEIYKGTNLRLLTLSRLDFLRSKLFAYLDRGIDLDDLRHLNPSSEEIAQLTEWLKDRDANPDWPEYVDIRLSELRQALGYENK